MAEKKEKKENQGSLAARAWNATKGDDDVEFDQIPNAEFKATLEHRAERTKATGIANVNFEKKVLELVEEDKAAGVDEGPMAVVDSPASLDAASDAPMAVAAEEAPKAKASSKGTKGKSAAAKAKAPGQQKKAAKAKGTKSTDQSGHVATGAEAAAAVEAAKTAPQNP